jgi:hypothetical protein
VASNRRQSTTGKVLHPPCAFTRPSLFVSTTSIPRRMHHRPRLGENGGADLECAGDRSLRPVVDGVADRAQSLKTHTINISSRCYRAALCGLILALTLLCHITLALH